jgi:hypothetical protein
MRGKADDWIDRGEEPYPWERVVVPKGQKVRHLRSNWAAEAAEIEEAIKFRIEVILGVRKLEKAEHELPRLGRPPAWWLLQAIASICPTLPVSI